MAVNYKDFNLQTDTTIIPIQFGDNTIGVKQYLPIQNKLELMSKVIEQAHDQDYNYANPVKITVYTIVEIIKYYTDIEFAKNELENAPSLYDEMVSSGLAAKIIEHIPQSEYEAIVKGINESVTSIYKYQNSILGVLNIFKNGYNDQVFDIEQIQKTLKELEDNSLIQEVVNNFQEG